MTSRANHESAIASEDPSRHQKPSLPQLCDQAADHVARARIALYDETEGSDQALVHLDEAIGCLKRLWEHGTRPKTAASEDAQAGLVEANSAQRRSA